MREIKPITMDGAIRLIQAILIDAHDSYIDALRTINDYREVIEKGLGDKCETYLDWRPKKRKYSKIMKKKPKQRTECENKFIIAFRSIPTPSLCSVKELQIYYNYHRAEREKNECELFYKSGQFKLYCGAEFTGEEIIALLKKEANYKYADWS